MSQGEIFDRYKVENNRHDLDRLEPLEAAGRFVASEFPDAHVVFVAGSVLRGQATSTSDLDLVVVGEEGPYRASYRAHGWPIEAFVHTRDSLRAFFASDVARRRPSLPQMCAEGRVILDRLGLADAIKAEAENLLQKGPPALSSQELAQLRYGLTDLLDDLVGSTDQAETRFIAAELAQRVADFTLIANGRWSGLGKWTLRALRRADQGRAKTLADALQAAVGRGETTALARFVEEALEPFGGRLFEGYSAGRGESTSSG